MNTTIRTFWDHLNLRLEMRESLTDTRERERSRELGWKNLEISPNHTHVFGIVFFGLKIVFLFLWVVESFDRTIFFSFFWGSVCHLMVAVGLMR